MATGSSSTPASLYGPVSLGLGLVAVAGVVLSGFVGLALPLLAGCLAVTFALLGLSQRSHRGKCLAGLLGGAVGVLYPAVLIAAWGM